jgi:hypothetical protein
VDLAAAAAAVRSRKRERVDKMTMLNQSFGSPAQSIAGDWVPPVQEITVPEPSMHQQSQESVVTVAAPLAAPLAAPVAAPVADPLVAPLVAPLADPLVLYEHGKAPFGVSAQPGGDSGDVCVFPFGTMNFAAYKLSSKQSANDAYEQMCRLFVPPPPTAVPNRSPRVPCRACGLVFFDALSYFWHEEKRVCPGIVPLQSRIACGAPVAHFISPKAISILKRTRWDTAGSERQEGLLDPWAASYRFEQGVLAFQPWERNFENNHVRKGLLELVSKKHVKLKNSSYCRPADMTINGDPCSTVSELLLFPWLKPLRMWPSRLAKEIVDCGFVVGVPKFVLPSNLRRAAYPTEPGEDDDDGWESGNRR